jgi:tetratricopeptide (TPR) repeat protein
LLGRKRAPNFLYDRREIYSIAEYYQNRLEAQGLWDEVDLTRSAIQNLGAQGDAFLYDLLVCDEVQDFSDIQLALLFRLVRSCNCVLLAGDTTQIINPSGFRWEEVKDRFFERGVQVPPLICLNLNFRCVRSIVRLANSLLDLKQKLVGLSGSELREEWKFNGKPPILINGLREEQVIEMVRIMGAGQIILVRDSAEGKKLKSELGTELVFTIYEAKGLEFDTVLLWRVCMGKKSATIWRKIKQDHQFDRSHLLHIKHEINLLYVAVTRARNALAIYDGSEPSDVWDVEVLGDTLIRTGQEDDLLKIWKRVSSPAEWEEQGRYFFEREHYPAAVECFRNAGNMEMTKTAQASGQNRRALKEEAETLTRGRKLLRSAVRYSALGMYDRSAPIFLQKGHTDIALREFEKIGDPLKLAGCYEKLGDHYSAAVELEKAEGPDSDGLIEEALMRYLYPERFYDSKRADKLFKEAGHYMRSGEPVKALRRFKAIHFPKGIYEAYLNLERDGEAIEYFVENDMLDEAEEYIREKPGCDVSPELIRRMFPDGPGEVFRPSFPHYRHIEFVVRLLVLCFKQHRDEETRAMIKKIIHFVSSNYYFGFRDRFPKEYLELALDLDCPNAVFRILSWRHYGPLKTRLPKNTTAYLAALKKKAELTANDSLLACYYYFHDREKYEDILTGLEAGPDNYALFAKSMYLFWKAVDYLTGAKEVEEAASIARSHKDYGLAGEIYEKAGDFRSAGKHYRDAERFDRAMVCFEKISDMREIARVYERMKAYQKALKIWETLENNREMQRLVRKINKEAKKNEQLDLF